LTGSTLNAAASEPPRFKSARNKILFSAPPPRAVKRAGVLARLLRRPRIYFFVFLTQPATSPLKKYQYYYLFFIFLVGEKGG